MQQNVLICPLYWGLGHATRMAALATIMNEKGFRIFVAAPSPLLRVFTDLPFEINTIEFNSYTPRYHKGINLTLSLLFQSPFMMLQALADHIRTGRIIRKFNIDILLSDNRFGCYNRNVHSVYITHQLNIRSPFKEGSRSRFLSSIHRFIINRYDECWIPDLPGEQNLSGLLSHPVCLAVPYRYVGILSRITDTDPVAPVGLPAGPFHLLILSGPEPMKSHFEKTVTAIYRNRHEHLVIAGSENKVAAHKRLSAPGNITRLGYADAASIKYLAGACSRIICRPGYSSVMDLVSEGLSALLVPTPGQTEQEYLATYLAARKLFSYQIQGKLDYQHIELSDRDIEYYNLNEESRMLTEAAIDHLPKK